MVEVGPSSFPLVEQQSTSPAAPLDSLPQGVCRDRYGRFNSSFFPLWACSLCYSYLFPGEEHLVLSHASWWLDLTTVDGDRLPSPVALYPSLLHGGVASLRDQKMCRWLGTSKCRRLDQCCSAAVRSFSNPPLNPDLCHSINEPGRLASFVLDTVHTEFRIRGLLCE
ncbi:hypothetical protein RRG08_022437 [Elysia crispata]|uniref:Uncharacterized protein n=1 Tax=Elysia crispata TaxID=231223 RepID=A0AAE0Z2F0_9GAST|nr:hypothetical protein RRG08_022437 [Elysia crispata]